MGATMRIIRLNKDYALWKQVTQNNSFPVYHVVDGDASRESWAGNLDFLYRVTIQEEDFADYGANFESGATVVMGEDEVIARAVGLAAVPALTAPDGTPLSTKRTLTLGTSHFGRTDNGQQQMALNGLAVGAPLVVWNGTGIADVGGDWTHEASGTEDPVADAGNGTNGMNSEVRSQGNETRFDSGANFDLAGTYDQLTFMMQPKAYPVGSRLEVLWKTAGGNNPGQALNVEDYVVNMDLDVWQQVTIPIADFNLGNDIAKLSFRYAAQGGQHFYFDDITITNAAGGGPYVYRTAPPAGEAWHVSMMVLVLAAPDTGWSSTSFVNISGGLLNGLMLRQRKLSTSETVWSLNTKDNLDLFGRYHPQETFVFDNNEMLVGFMVKPGSVADVVVTEDAVLEYMVRDDLSSLNNIRAFLHFGVEDIS